MNIAEILKYCPKGTKLYSPTWGNVKLIEVTSDEVIKIKAWKFTEELTSDGRYSDKGECVIFPSKDQRDWSKFRLPVKRGDIMMSSITKRAFIASGEFTKNGGPKYICGVNAFDTFQIAADHGDSAIWTSDFYIPASEEAKKKLFDKIEKAGYRWNTNTLKLEKIEPPMFKEGNVLIKYGTLFLSTGIIKNNIIQAYCLRDDGTFIDCGVSISSSLELASITDRNKLFSTIVKSGYKYDKEQHKLVKQEFKPFDKVLVRYKDTDTWEADIYLDYHKEAEYYCYKCTRMNYHYCIPYEGNEYLLGTTDSPT